jgi:hypothetical protein
VDAPKDVAVVGDGLIIATSRVGRVRAGRRAIDSGLAVIVPDAAVLPGSDTLTLFAVGANGRLHRLPIDFD